MCSEIFFQKFHYLFIKKVMTLKITLQQYKKLYGLVGFTIPVKVKGKLLAKELNRVFTPNNHIY